MLLAEGKVGSKLLRTYNTANESEVRRAKGRMAHVGTGDVEGQITQGLGAKVNILDFT